MIQDLSKYAGNYGKITNLDELKRLIDVLYNKGLTISFDLETGYTGPDRVKAALDVYDPTQFIVGFAVTNDVRWARYVPLLHDFGANLDPTEVWPLMKPLLEDLPVVCHNVVFEARNLLALDRKGHGPVITMNPATFHDTMLQSYVLSLTQYHGLKGLTKHHYNYDQAELDSLFPGITEKQKQCIRFNPLDIENPSVIDYVCDDVTWTLRLDNDHRSQAETERSFIYNVEREIAGILIDMRETGIAVDWDGIEVGLSQYKFFYQQMEARTRKLFEDATGRDLTALNFRSSQQMGKLLFDDEEGLGLTPAQTTKSGKPSTAENSLEALRGEHKAVDQLLRYRQTKKMGEFFENWSKLRTAYDDRVHPNFKQTTVQSGRFASDAPNIQNITKKWWFTTYERDLTEFPSNKDGDKAWEKWVKDNGKNGTEYWAGNARDYLMASPGYTLLSFDYSQQELRVLAGLSKEPYLIEAFEQGLDIHKATASLMFNVPIEEVTEAQRQRAKTINFGLIYQQGAKALGDSLGISKDEAQELFDKYFSSFSKVSGWFDQVKREGVQRGIVESFMGRKSTVWELQSSNKAIRSKGERLLVNMPVQGGGADITKVAMIRTKRMLLKKGWWNTKVRLLMNQHDSLVFEVSNDLDLAEVRSLIAPEVSFPLQGFPKFAIDWEVGQRWGSGLKWKDGPPPGVEHEEEPKKVEVFLPTEFLVNFIDKPTKDVAVSISKTLKSYPGSCKVVFSMDGNLVPVNFSVDPSPILVAELTAVTSGLCTVDLRK